MIDYHAQFLAFVDETEAAFPVAEWRIGDVQLWPLVRSELYIDMHWAAASDIGARAYTPPYRGVASRILKVPAYAATPLINIWRSRSDLKHLVLRPKQADTLFLGDGVALDKIDGAYRDLFCEPIIRAIEEHGSTAMLMERGDIRRLPLSRATLPANMIERWARLRAVANRTANPDA